jgi:hypothetical protein
VLQKAAQVLSTRDACKLLVKNGPGILPLIMRGDNLQS